MTFSDSGSRIGVRDDRKAEIASALFKGLAMTDNTRSILDSSFKITFKSSIVPYFQDSRVYKCAFFLVRIIKGF